MKDNVLFLTDDPLNKGYRHRRPGFYDTMAASNATATDFMIDEVIEGRPTGRRVPEESLTDQSQKDDADINVMIRRFGLVNVKATAEQLEALSGIEIDAQDYRESLDKIRNARELFDDLPADVRKEFDNDPASFLQAFEDTSERNLERMKRLGLVKEREIPVDSPELSVLKEIRDGVRKDVGGPAGPSGGPAKAGG